MKKYTLTLKAVSKVLKGNKLLLIDAYHQLLTNVCGTSNYHVFEKENTPDLHLHALINTESIIKSKKQVTPTGFHLYMKVVPYKDYDKIVDIWNNYIHKESSDADRYTLLYGCSFNADNIINYNEI